MTKLCHLWLRKRNVLKKQKIGHVGMFLKENKRKIINCLISRNGFMNLHLMEKD